MLSVALYTPNLIAADGIEQLTQESNVFNLVVKASPIPPIPSVLRELQVRDPDVILLDLGDWDAVSQIATAIERSSFKGVTIGFRPAWTQTEQLTFEEMGIRDLLHEPFSHSELERAANRAIHRDHAITKQNILAFISAKAGGGCSTVALNTGAALASSFSKNVLLIKRRSVGRILDSAEFAKQLGAIRRLATCWRDDPIGMARALREGARNGSAFGGPEGPWCTLLVD